MLKQCQTMVLMYYVALIWLEHGSWYGSRLHSCTWNTSKIWWLHIVYTTVLQRQTHREIPTSSKLRPAANRVTKTIATRFSYLQELKGPGSELDSCFQRCSCWEICNIGPVVFANLFPHFWWFFLVRTHSTWSGFAVLRCFKKLISTSSPTK